MHLLDELIREDGVGKRQASTRFDAVLVDLADEDFAVALGLDVCEKTSGVQLLLGVAKGRRNSLENHALASLVNLLPVALMAF